MMQINYTGHEHLNYFGFINMNGRMYGYSSGRMFSPDNYVQAPDFTQSYNRYSYCWNNPLKYTDPTGEIIDGIIIGAMVLYGAYTGGRVVNNGESNPSKWNWSSGSTYVGVIGGGVVGGVSAGIGNSIAAGGGFLANTSAIAMGSYFNSMGMFFVTGGKTDVSMSFGFGSFNFTTGEFGYLGKEGNSGLENVFYALGAVGNLGDAANVVDHFTGWEDKLSAKASAYMDKWRQDNPNAVVDPSTVGQNAGRSFPSYFGKNPKILGTKLDYMGMVDGWNWREYAGYLHDVEYSTIHNITKGAKYLFGSWSTYGSDIRLMVRTLYLGLKHNAPLEIMFGGGIGVANTIKAPYGWMIKRP